ncbi:hypothetical protein PLICRDRAFT_700299 [Plicaturopsis crispa FD-325 SS-3]|nr:hypothetical protein PLICRDRAFT_700299 [Plicaturopsis crispa FD-325 SS-3]
MHHCLQISEVLSCVFSMLSPHGDLARLARTCRAFRDPALDILWNSLSGLEPLIHTLPADLWEKRRSEDAHGIAHTEILFLRPMRDTDWTRFHIYGQRVRLLDLMYSSCYYDEILDPAVLSALHVSASTFPLLPNLKYLALGDDDQEHAMPHLAMLVHPKITSFTFGIDAAAVPLGIATLLQLPAALPALTELAVHDLSDVYQLVVAAVSKVVGAWDILTQLSVPGLSSHALATVSAFSALHTLNLAYLESTDMQHTPESSFSSLRTLRLAAPCLSVCTAFLSLLPLKHTLHTIELSPLDPSPTPDVYHAFFDALAAHCSPLTLECISITNPQDDAHQDDGVHVDVPAMLAPLIPFSRLDTLRVHLPWSAAFDDTAVPSWPRLRILHLLPHAGGISHTAFADLVTLCTALRELCIPVEFGADLAPAEFRAGAAMGADRVPNVHLDTLAVRRSAVADVAGMAAFLRSVCPNLRNLPAEQDRESWQDVLMGLVTERATADG